jgi:hypothetical protein
MAMVSQKGMFTGPLVAEKIMTMTSSKPRQLTVTASLVLMDMA